MFDDEDIAEIPMATVITSRPANMDRKKKMDLHSIGDRNSKKVSSGKDDVGPFSLSSATNYPKSKQTNEQPSADIKDVKNWPPKLKEQIIKSLKRPPNVDRANTFFEKHNWPIGLREEVCIFKQRIHSSLCKIYPNHRFINLVRKSLCDSI